MPRIELIGGPRAGTEGNRRVIREAFAAHGGDEVDALGDSFLDVFGRAQDAAIDVDQPPGDCPSKHLPHDGAARGRFSLTTSEPALAYPVTSRRANVVAAIVAAIVR
jgi:hypothetical protein